MILLQSVTKNLNFIKYENYIEIKMINYNRLFFTNIFASIYIRIRKEDNLKTF